MYSLHNADHLVLRAGGVKPRLGGTLVGEHAPVGLVLFFAIVTNALGLPGLVECLEIENINTPFEHATDSLLVVLLRIFSAGLSWAIVRSAVYCPVS